MLAEWERKEVGNAGRMGKKGSWFSAIKRVFIPHSKEKLNNETDKRSGKEKKKKGLGKLRNGETNSFKGLGKLRNGETNSFIPLFREPSSIEKILGEAEREHKLIFRPTTPPEQPTAPPIVPHKAASPRIASPRAPSPRTASPPRAPSPRTASPTRAPSPPKVVRPRPEPTLRNHHASATKIQAAYRGYMARRSFRALKGLVRLQGLVQGQNVKHQTTTAMKHMQVLVRVQSQFQSRRILMLENQARQQSQFNSEKEVESTLGKLTFSQASEAGNEDWDDSLLTKEEIEARMQRKVEAVIKRERAMAYAYSNQLWKGTPKSVHAGLSDIHARGSPWWWNWLERQLSSSNAPESQGMKNFQLTPPRPNSEMMPSPKLPSSSKQHQSMFENMDTPTPKSTRSTVLPTTRLIQTPPSRILQASSSGLSKYSRQRASGFDLPLKDDDSLTSCPPFSVPNYMTSTVSAKAKSRANSNPKEIFMGTPGSESSKRRLSFPLTQGIGSFKWSRGSLFSGKDSSSQRGLESIGNMSVDSTVSLPARVGRKAFNRFV